MGRYAEKFVHISLPGLEHSLCGRELTPSLRRTTRDEDATCGICRMIAHSAKLAAWESPANPERDEGAP
jgi:hypothetical protein